jgi:YggT family protein
MGTIVPLLINLINLVSWLIVILVFLQVILSYIVSPYNSFRVFVDRIVEPLLTPIRRNVPTLGMFDFSPLVLIILVQIFATILTRLLIMLL